MADLFAGGVPQAPQSTGMGNLFGENNAAQMAAQQQAIQRMQALSQAQLTPAQNGAFMATNAGNMFGNAIGQVVTPPDPRQIKLAQIKQAVDQEAEQAGITEPEQYLRLAASKLVQAGEYQAALEAQKQADSLGSGQAGKAKVESEAAKNFSEANKNNQGTLEAYAKQPYEIKLAQMKANATDPESRKRIAEADQMIKDSAWTDRKMGAEIDKLYAEASKLSVEALTAQSQKDRENLNEQASRLIEFTRLREAKGLPVNPADIQALERITRILAQAPQPTIQSSIAKQLAGELAGATGATPTPMSAPKSAKKAAPAGVDKAGKPYYKYPDGKFYYEPPK